MLGESSLNVYPPRTERLSTVSICRSRYGFGVAAGVYDTHQNGLDLCNRLYPRLPAPFVTNQQIPVRYPSEMSWFTV